MKSATSFTKHFFCFLTLMLAANSFAQNAAADTIRQQLAKLDPKSPNYLDERIGGLGTLFLSIVHTDPFEALKVSDQLAACMKQKGDSVGYYEAFYRHKAIAYNEMGDYAKNIFYLEAYAEALNLLGKSDGYAYVDVGNAYFGFDLRMLARDCYKQAEKVFEKENNIPGQCTVHNNFAQLYMLEEHYDSALYELRITHGLRLNKLKDVAIAGDSKFLIGICFDDLHQYDSAKYYFHQVLSLLGSKVLNEHTDHVALQDEYSGAYTRLANVYVSEKNWDSAVYYLNEGFVFFRTAGYTRKINNCYGTWAHLYLEKGMPDSALANIVIYENKITANGNADSELRLYKLYADYFTSIGDNEGYYKYMMRYYLFSDSLQKETLNEGTLLASGTMMQMKNKSRIEEQNIKLEQQEKEKIMLVAISGLFLFIISAGIFIFFQIRKKNKVIQRYNVELEEANATKEKFLSVISHDLRNPFNTLIGMSNVLVTNVKENKLAQVVSNAEAINESSRKAYVLLDNLMQWVSLQKEKIIVNKELLQVNEIVEEVLRLFRNQALAQSITIQKDLRAGVIFTDRNLLQVVFRNLLSNAVRHIRVGGSIKLRIEERGKDISIVVEDNGHGIDKEKLEVLFNKQSHASIARKGGGLGLLLVQEFVEQLGGTITAENILSGGARFTVVLYQAAVESSVQLSGINIGIRELIFTSDEKEKMSLLIREIEKHEFFDTTELRECLEKFDTSESVALHEWAKKLSQAVYHANKEQFKKLIDLA